MHYSHQAQLSEITGLPVMGESSVTFWTSNAPHMIAARDDAGWSLLESTGSLVGEFVSDNGGFTIISDDGAAVERFDNWRSAVRHILRRGLRAA
ncbi:hypothetical protein [Glaciihabitans sp. GrIS 2.15]|uniref:hypothetical protein n=1 Tax=Glaciihabitans sp. GrIS 2.15 TaxID=3071710 RepID=UPI002E042280|nr:hypothetical protein [Glaciihabitans sp. GrIS 2.15]